ncbi:hypothetical protein LNTAR_22010 [Lentisphaera araneosa HTCC2155]|uniref:Uncharacterized protein n=1 Tax=Lentisphaera araneosa HTCC2155 TaxID=313628 RepID=A6DSL3_9BACT|nr:hypothetical protein [Lentisphaera araneosa]EDM25366.1 hypothetical protein LNTAR_22010 [Lentisphaera araneosa HTCC2155]
MKYFIGLVSLFISVSAWAKIDMRQYKESVQLGEQIVSISKAEIIINKMPSIGEQKSKRYMIVNLNMNDGKKIVSEYKILSLSFPGCTRRFHKKVSEIRESGCVVRALPSWAGKGVLVALEIEDAQGKKTKLKASPTEMTVHLF